MPTTQQGHLGINNHRRFLVDPASTSADHDELDDNDKQLPCVAAIESPVHRFFILLVIRVLALNLKRAAFIATTPI